VNPSHENDREDRREQLAGYVLGALDPAEAVALEAHLAGCERCRSELRWLEPAVRALGTSVPQLEAPRQLRRRTMKAARAEVEPSSGAPERRTWRLRLTPPVAGLAVSLVALAVGAGYLAGTSDTSETSTPTVALEAATDTGPAGNVVIHGDQATLQVSDLPQLREGDVYQAWVQRDGVIEPSTTFIVDRTGRGAAAIPGVSGAQELMITREPPGGSTKPSTAPILRAPLDSS
jgi:anti-sigma factor RsiW